MTRVSEKRVVVATLFLPWTVNFELAEKKRKDRLIAKTEEKNNAKPNLIQSLAQHKQPKDAKEELFDFKEPEKLVQPRSRQQREEEIKKLPPLSISNRRHSAIDSAKAFADAPWSVKPTVTGNIGLNNALFSIQDQLESLAWVGTLGMSTDALLQKTKEEINSTFESRYNTYPVMPSDITFDGHYNQYCKQVMFCVV